MLDSRRCLVIEPAPIEYNVCLLDWLGTITRELLSTCPATKGSTRSLEWPHYLLNCLHWIWEGLADPTSIYSIYLVRTLNALLSFMMIIILMN